MAGRCKPGHFGQASPTQMTCALTTEADTNYGLTHGRAPNKRYLNIDSDIMNPEKITNRSK